MNLKKRTCYGSKHYQSKKKREKVVCIKATALNTTILDVNSHLVFI